MSHNHAVIPTCFKLASNLLETCFKSLIFPIHNPSELPAVLNLEPVPGSGIIADPAGELSIKLVLKCHFFVNVCFHTLNTS